MPGKDFTPFLMVLAVVAIVLNFVLNQKWRRPAKPFPSEWRRILQEKVLFYRLLPDAQRPRFEQRVRQLLKKWSIKGIDTGIDETDRLLIASSALIPLFGFPGWEYLLLKKIEVYEKDSPAPTSASVMRLSKTHLHQCFEKQTSEQSPSGGSYLDQCPYLIPWIHYLYHRLQEQDTELPESIRTEPDFVRLVNNYFFFKQQRLEKEHPQVHERLEEIARG